ncbi:hypothetical protein D9M70_542600 [compost metagenome]
MSEDLHPLLPEALRKLGPIRRGPQQSAEQQGDDIFIARVADQVIERDAADDQFAGLTVDMGELRFGGDDVFKSVLHHQVSPLRRE